MGIHRGKDNLYFIPIENLIVLKESDISIKKVVDSFRLLRTEVIYVCGEEDSIVGIISPGDLHRHFFNDDRLINTGYSSIESLDYSKVWSIFDHRPKLHEIPVVNDGHLLGVVTSGIKKAENEWEQIDSDLDLIERTLFFVKQIEYISKQYNAKGIHMILLEYPPERDVLYEEDIKNLNEKRCKYRDGQLHCMTDNELEDFFGEYYYPGIGDDFQHDFDRIEAHSYNGRIMFKEMHTRFFNTSNGKRVTQNADSCSKYRILLVGACFVFGAYVEDACTISSYLQSIVNQRNGAKYEVINCGNLGKPSLDVLYCEELKCGDIVIAFASHLELKLAFRKLELRDGQIKRIMTDPFRGKPAGFFFNSLSHHNHIINKEIAEYIFGLIDHSKKCSGDTPRKAMQDYYIDADAALYYEHLKKEYSYIKQKNSVIGAVVMNCNPFTMGHRELIEYALDLVDHLIIFVVQEDRSFFSFDDRYNMVLGGVRDLTRKKKVTVLPSGQYIISKDTFAQYFEKEKEFATINNMEYDLRLFGEVVCPVFGITKRFVGEEPTDPVTAAYNETMKRILPGYGIELEEIERANNTDGDMISATRVRKLYNEQSWKEMEKYVPESTVEYLKEIRAGKHHDSNKS